MLATFGIVVVLLSVYEFGLSGRLEHLGIWENVSAIAVGAVVAVIPTYSALRKQRRLHKYALSAIRDLKEAEAVLGESERRFRELLENIELLAVALDKNGLITFCNSHMLRLTGWSREEVYGRDYFPLFSPDANVDLRRRVFLERLDSGGVPSHIANQIKRKSGELRDIVWNSTVFRDGTGKVVGTASIGDDVTDRRRAETRLQIQHAVTAVLAEAAPMAETYPKILEKLGTGLRWDAGALWIVDRSAKVLRCAGVWTPPSKEFQRFSAVNGRAALAQGKCLPGGVWADGRTAWRADVMQDPLFERGAMAAELGLCGWIGFPIMLPNRILGVVEFFSAQMQAPDEEMLATLAAIGMQIGQFMERRQIEEQFRQAQKMEAIGTLSGGIAHDFNNIIGCMIGYTELAIMNLSGNPTVVEYLNDVLVAARRAADLVRQILMFSRQQDQERKPIQLRQVVSEALKLLRATIPATIDFEVSLEEDVPTVLADATQIHQILMNLGTNALHAMKDRPGRLTVAIGNFDVGQDFAQAHPGLQPGHYVRLSISDTGHGMDQVTVSRIFEPFFTTKGPGEGTGLGLAVVQGIMQSHEGTITVYSHPGEGTTFHLYFPAHGAEEAKAGSELTEIPRGQGEHILFVDDERVLARMGMKILERLGYVVEVHTSATEALDAVRGKPEAYDLVVTDQMMPKLTGFELATQLLEIRRDLPIILVTGYTATLTSERVQAMGIRKLLLKPISIATLGAAVHYALSESKPTRLKGPDRDLSKA